MDCPHQDDCRDAGALFGKTVQLGDESLTHKPSPHIGGDGIDNYCIYVLGQNPGNEIDDPKFRTDTDAEFLVMHHWRLQEVYTPRKFLKKFGLSWRYVVWDNVVRCPTEDNKMPATCKKNCSDWTLKQISLLEPDFMIVMGSHARDWMNDTFDMDLEFGDYKITDLEQENSRLADLVPMYCVPHYGYLMRTGSLDDEAELFRESIRPGIDEVAHVRD